MEPFYCDLSKKTLITWDDLINDLNQVKEYNYYCYEENDYLVFKTIILSILLNEKIVLLDNDFSEAEINRLIGEDNITQFIMPIENKRIPKIRSKFELLNKLNQVDGAWSVTMFTSGTTGIPKKISHSFTSLTRFAKTSDKNKSNIWGFAYNSTHIAGLQVFFQALLNGNTIIKLFGLSKKDIFHSIEKYSITHISATPTFYRLLLPSTGIFPKVYRITSGGEKFDEKTISNLKLLFPTAKISNIYASTEAGTLFAANGNTFTIKTEMLPLIKIENNELLIHKSLIGITEMDIDIWYNTGDIVTILSEKPFQFQFKSRKNEMINVGGYKVNPDEVEEVIRNIREVVDVRVYSKNNSVLGNIVCCEIIKTNDELSEVEVRLKLQKQLQEFKIPRIIKFVDKITTTRSGKIKRN